MTPNRAIVSGRAPLPTALARHSLALKREAALCGNETETKQMGGGSRVSGKSLHAAKRAGCSHARIRNHCTRDALRSAMLGGVANAGAVAAVRRGIKADAPADRARGFSKREKSGGGSSFGLSAFTGARGAG